MAIKGPTRIKQLPGVPTVAERDMPEYADKNWPGSLAPAGMPDAVGKRLADAMIAVVERSVIVSALESQASRFVGSGPAAFRAFIAADTARRRRKLNAVGSQHARVPHPPPLQDAEGVSVA